jgi:lipoprotein-releasing system permease protein
MQLWLEFSIAWRYVRSRESGAFVTFISLVSIVGIALGVAALLCILSVMNGFAAEARERLLKVNAHVTVEVTAAPVTATTNQAETSAAMEQRVSQWLRQQPEVTAFAPYTVSDALLVHEQTMVPAKLRGIELAAENTIEPLDGLLVEGELGALAQPMGKLLLGRELAEQLGANSGDNLTVLVPEANNQSQLEPKLAQWQVTGQFEAGISENDGVWVLANRDDVKLLAPHAQSGLRLRLKDPWNAPRFRQKVLTAFPQGIKVSDWTLDNATFFRATHLEKLMMTIILSLIVAVAVFNIVAMLSMVVRSKRLDIAILRTLGLAPERVERIFMLQGLLIGWGGSLIGLVVGMVLATHAGVVAQALERLFNFQILSSEVFYITVIPSELHGADVLTVLTLAMGLSFWATRSPARRAAATLPSDVLRYEQ